MNAAARHAQIAQLQHPGHAQIAQVGDDQGAHNAHIVTECAQAAQMALGHAQIALVQERPAQCGDEGAQPALEPVAALAQSAHIELDLDHFEKQLRVAPLAVIREQWLSTFGTAAPATLRRDMLVRAILWRMQAEREPLASSALKALRDAAATASAARSHKGKPRAGKLEPATKPGTRYVRVWQGETHLVESVPEGYRWRDSILPSLSAVATAITGTRWNGPRFFGLRDQGEKRLPGHKAAQ